MGGEEVQLHSFLTLALDGNETGWGLELVWLLWRIKKSLAPARIEMLDHLPCSSVTVLTELSWFPLM
jgi:hypothetical protein